MPLFNKNKRPEALLSLKEALEAILGRLDSLEKKFETMRLDWEIVTAHLDQQSTKVHRELGHVTKRKADLLKLEGGDEPEAGARKSRFRGGRGR